MSSIISSDVLPRKCTLPFFYLSNLVINYTSPSLTSVVCIFLCDGLNTHAINGISPSNKNLRERDSKCLPTFDR